jgi:multidrug efflux pump subunit AcrB
MSIVAPAIDRYRLTVLGLLLLLILGALAYARIPRMEDPLIQVPAATVLVPHPGAGPRDVERFVSRPIEERINEIESVDRITSTSSQGTALILLEFDPDTDMDQNMQEVREKVREAEKDLPEEAQAPEITRHKTETVSMIINLSGPFSYWELYRYARRIKRGLEKVPQIMTLEIEGYPEREVRVQVDENRLAQFRISLQDIIDLLGAENVSLPGGHMDVGKRRYLVRVDEEFTGAGEIGETIIGAYAGRPVFLEDVSEVTDTYEEPAYLVRFNGRPGINVLVTQKPRSDMLAVSRTIRHRLEALSTALPPSLEIAVAADQSVSVSERIRTFGNNLALGAGLVLLCTAVLMNLRMGLIVAFLLPLSICFALITLYHLGHTLNQITLASMVIVLGMLVDSGIVVVENIQRHLAMGKVRLAAALDGSGEVLGAITSSTLTTVLAFTPLFFMTGETGQFIRGIPLTMISALAGSLLVATFVSPLLSHRFLKAEDGELERKEGRTIRVYAALLRRVLDHKTFFLILAAAAFVLSILFIPRLGLQFFPKAEKRWFLIDVTLPPGSNFDATSALAGDIERVLMGRQEVESVMAHLGGAGPRIYYNINFFRVTSPNRAQFFVRLKGTPKGIRADAVIRTLRPELAGLPGARIELKELEQGPPVGAPVAVAFKGDDLDVLKRLVAAYRSVLETIPGAVDVSDDASDETQQIRIRVDTEKARILGITHAVLARTLRSALYGTTATTFRVEDEEVDVVVSLAKQARNRIATFQSLYLTTVFGTKVPFTQIAEIRLVSDIATISRENLTRTMTLRCEVEERLAEDIVDELKRRTASFHVPAGCLVEVEGETKNRTESFMSLGWAMMAAFLLVYIVLVAQFNSFRQPLIIALSLPFGLVGAVLGLWVTGYPFGFMAFLGVVSLTGIVVNDAIVLIDFINGIRREGGDVRQAVIQAGKLRFRPVMLTTISTVGGLLPLAVRGGSLWGPMGNVIIFGLSMATVLTLILIPLVYELIEGGGRAGRGAQVPGP